MQYRNSIDIELVQAASAMYDSLVRVCENLEMSPDRSVAMLRLKNAVYRARTEMQLQEEEDKGDLVAPLAPPTSMD